MTNTVIRHYGTSRRDVPHPVTSSRCRLTLDPTLVTCPACIAAPPPDVVTGTVLSTADTPGTGVHLHISSAIA